MKAPGDALADLAAVVASGQCVLFAGSGLSETAGLPDWAALARLLLDWARTRNLLSPRVSASLGHALDEGQPDLVWDGVVTVLEEKILRADLVAFLRHNLLSRPLSPSCQALSRMRFSAALTSNWDDLTERTFPGKRIFTLRDREPPAYFHDSEFFLAKLYGDLAEPGSLVMTGDRLREAIDENLPWLQFLQGLTNNRPILFVGVTLDGLSALLETVRLKKAVREHWALAPANKSSSWAVNAERLTRRFGVSVIPYQGAAELPALIDRLAKLVSPAGAASAPARPEASPHLKRLVVENVGPFERAEFEFGEKWNVLLGNNGVGKSSILRALVTAICGSEAAPWAERVIRAGRTSATIQLETARNTYITSVHRTSSGASITQTPVRPLEAEGWLAIGFPPLRTAAGTSPSTPEGLDKPSAEDLLPLLRGEADPRLEKLKQWIVNLDYRIKDQLTQTTPDPRFQRLFDEFFRIVSDLTEGVPISEPQVDPATRQVTVKTADGRIPLDLVSQGTASLISWVGVILQRLYEVYGSDPEPLKRHAIVLVDEIDAHMHPGWQQMLTTRLEKIFPAIQFIATTHSPLIVAGMTGRQVHLFERGVDGTGVEITRPAMDFRGMRADQILTSVFGLTSSRDARSNRLHELKVKKLGGDPLTTAEASELDTLENDRHAQTHLVGDTPAQEQARAMIGEASQGKLAAMPEKERKQVLAELASGMREILGAPAPPPAKAANPRPATKQIKKKAAKQPAKKVRRK